jgi:REP element-mobilizing transposase RayT
MQHINHRPDKAVNDDPPPTERRQRRLRHLDAPGLIQHVTFRLHDSLPAHVLRDAGLPSLGKDERAIPEDSNVPDASLESPYARLVDAGYGECWLRRPEVAESMVKILLHFDGERYQIVEWCVMPNHVHVLVQCHAGWALPRVVQGWKSFGARTANAMLQRSGPFWAPDYFDRFIRDGAHLATVRQYIRDNPVAAGLVARAEDWRWSSAGRWQDRGCPEGTSGRDR